MNTLRYYFFIFYFILFLVNGGCENVRQTNWSEDKTKQNDRERARLNGVLKVFKEDEKSALDSIDRYSIKPIYDSCLKYLYVLNSTKRFIDTLNCLNNRKTIGECQIHIHAFVNKGMYIRDLLFSISINDSTPCGIMIATTPEEFIHGFRINTRTGKITAGLVRQHGTIDFPDIRHLYDSTLVDKGFHDYIVATGGRLSNQCREILSRESILPK